MDVIRDPGWQFVGAVLALLALVVMVIVFLVQRQRKGLSYEFMTNAPVITVKDEDVGDLKLMFQGQQVTKSRLLMVRFSNTGNVPIQPADYETPITLSLAPGGKILSAAITGTEPPNINIAVTSDSNAVSFSKALLNARDTFICRILVSGYEGEPSITCRVAGVKEITVVRDISSLVWAVISMVGATCAMLAVILSPKPGSRYPTELRPDEIPYFVLGVTGLVMMVAFLIVEFRRVLRRRRRSTQRSRDK